MKQTKKLGIIAALGVVMFFAGAAIAQDANAVKPSAEVAKILAPVENLIDRNTYVVAHVDVTALNVDQANEMLKKALDLVITKVKTKQDIVDIINESGKEIDELQKESVTNLENVAVVANVKLDELKACGLTDVYVLANSRMMMIIPVQVVFVCDAGKFKELRETLGLPEEMPGSGVYQLEKGNQLIFNAISPMLQMQNSDSDSMKAMVEKELGKIKPTLRPELILAMEKYKKAPIKITFAPDSALKGMIGMGLMMAPPEIAEVVKAKTITDGIQWVSIGLDPMRFIFASTIQSKSPEAAQALLDMVIAVQEMQMKRMEEMGMPEEVVSNIWTSQKTMEKFLPLVNGNQIQSVLNMKNLEERVESVLDIIAGPLFEPFLAARGAARRMQSTNNLKQIGLAFHNHHEKFPPLYTIDASGKPLHSWRVLILPYIEQVALYEQIRLDEPWDSEHNKQFHNIDIPQFQNPGVVHSEPGMTDYSVIVGKETAFPLPKPGDKPLTFGAMTDGTSNTIAAVERAKPVCWMDPTQEITFEEASQGINVSENGIGGPSKGGVNVLFWDGSVQFLPETIALDVLKGFLTKAGGEAVSYYSK